MIRLEKITQENFDECINLKVAEEQKDFVSSPTLSLAKAYIHYDVISPFAIYNDDIIVGFIMLRYNEGYNSYFIWQLMIDEKYQSKGYGKQATKLAIEWMKKDERCKEIVTTYKKGNNCARDLYLKLGFEHMEDFGDDEMDMVLRW
ncbi:GNAT family N-acetyltransferase [Oceanirhabdus sp. W0125-5]|uniref:GNAT family N-acetyltransferase n=1 Tax=Oceanirhabdus sp. W0125-5 TaxID=2999116 RepID=UPI0022F2F796|nr:GNAT family N-acetyltransferase [Oceanirhabdus sp. W0125-5]WBW96304.1 GNAT family N-acetyltransferase [Oceanirhabdus sp. W0125-5]